MEKGVCSSTEHTQLPSKHRNQDEKGAIIFDQNEHERSEQVPQRTWCDVDANAAPSSFPEADRITLLHNERKNQGYSTNQTLVKVLVGGESSVPFVPPVHNRGKRTQATSLEPCDALRAAAERKCHHLDDVASVAWPTLPESLVANSRLNKRDDPLKFNKPLSRHLLEILIHRSHAIDLLDPISRSSQRGCIALNSSKIGAPGDEILDKLGCLCLNLR